MTAALLFLLLADLHFVDVATDRGIGDFTMAPGMAGGVAAADFDDDGDVDLFVPNAEGVPDQLYRNRGDGHFEEIATRAGVASTARTRTALWLDYDGDGALDLFTAGDCFQRHPDCAATNTLRLYRQTAPAFFEDVTVEAGLGADVVFGTAAHRTGAAAGDVNGDGWLDLTFALWDGRARLLLNNGASGPPGFTDVSDASGLGAHFQRHWQPVMHDFDGDGRLDVFYAIDFAPNRLWRNEGNGTFADVAPAAGVDVPWNDMGVTLGDYDGDGEFDLFITEIFGDFEHNALLRNDSTASTLSFAETALVAGVADAGFAWGATFFDADLDGRLDLAVTNGFYGPGNENDPSRFFLNAGGDPVAFVDASATVAFDDTYWGSALVAFDADRDGDLELVQACALGGPLRLLDNRVANGAHHLTVRPRMAGPNHRAIGAVVEIDAGGVNQRRLITAGTSHMGQEPAEAHFGLGAETAVDCVRIHWPDGAHSALADVAADQRIEAWRPGCPADLDGNGVVDTADLLILLGAWNESCHAGDLDGNGRMNSADVLSLAGAWGSCE